jgi:hypothetical protein
MMEATPCSSADAVSAARIAAAAFFPTGCASAEKLEQQSPQRVQVAAPRGLLAPQYLGAMWVGVPSGAPGLVRATAPRGPAPSLPR